jgi:squalene-associated FAD-dependent desaturase
VVGGGLAGLAAAVELKAAGWRVEVFERGRLLGGRATSYEVDGHEVDNGQHVFLGCCSEFIDFATGLGMGDRLKLQDRFDALVLAPGRPPGRLRAAGLPAPWHLAAGLLRYRELPARDRLRVAAAMLGLSRRREDRRTLDEWLRARGQSEASRRAFWEPFFVPALNAPLDHVTVAEVAFVVRTAFLADAGAARFGFLTVPLARLAETAAAGADAVHLRAPVARLERSASGAVGLWTGEGRFVAVDACVLALPPDRLERLLAEGDRLGLPRLDGFTARPIVDVHVWHDRGSLGFDFAALLASPVQWVFEKAPGYLCCSLSDAGEAVARPEAELVEIAWADLVARVPALAGARLRRGAATRSPEATFAAPPGVTRPGPGTAASNVAIAGSWTDTGWPDTMESAVRSGRAAARHLIAGRAAPPPPTSPARGEGALSNV